MSAPSLTVQHSAEEFVELLEAARVLVDEANSFGWSGKSLKSYSIRWDEGRGAHVAFAKLRQIVEAHR